MTNGPVKFEAINNLTNQAIKKKTQKQTELQMRCSRRERKGKHNLKMMMMMMKMALDRYFIARTPSFTVGSWFHAFLLDGSASSSWEQRRGGANLDPSCFFSDKVFLKVFAKVFTVGHNCRSSSSSSPSWPSSRALLPCPHDWKLPNRCGLAVCVTQVWVFVDRRPCRKQKSSVRLLLGGGSSPSWSQWVWALIQSDATERRFPKNSRFVFLTAGRNTN